MMGGILCSGVVEAPALGGIGEFQSSGSAEVRLSKGELGFRVEEGGATVS